MPNRISNIQPHRIDKAGIVTFTDGTNTGLIANQRVCEAYGYTYDRFSGTCRLNQQFEATLLQEFNQESNKVMGSNNHIENGVRNVIIGGKDNNVKSNSKNSIVSGNTNVVDTDINNATVLGVRGNATRQSEFVIGGGVGQFAYSDTFLYSDRQMSIVELSGITSDNTATKLTINGDGTNYINVKNNSILGYEVYITRFEHGGSSGTAGNFSYRNLKGVVRIDDSYGMTITTGFTRNIAKLGVNGTTAIVDSSTTDIKSITVQCTDRNNVLNSWSAIVYLHEFISTDTKF